MTEQEFRQHFIELGYKEDGSQQGRLIVTNADYKEKGDLTGDIAIYAPHITLSGEIKGNLYLGGGEANLPEIFSLTNDLVLMGIEKVFLGGSVDGDVRGVVGTLTIDEDSEIGGSLIIDKATTVFIDGYVDTAITIGSVKQFTMSDSGETGGSIKIDIAELVQVDGVLDGGILVNTVQKFFIEGSADVAGDVKMGNSAEFTLIGDVDGAITGECGRFAYSPDLTPPKGLKAQVKKVLA